MINKYRLLLVLFVISLAGCSNNQKNPKMPYEYWSFEVIYPHYMEVETKYAVIITQDNKTYSTWPSLMESTTSEGAWSDDPGGTSAGINMRINLPKHISICWLSYLDKKTYWAEFDVPLSARQTMIKSFELSPINDGEPPIIRYLRKVRIGLTPNGNATVWLSGNPLPDFKAPIIAKVQGREMINNKNCNSGSDDPNDIPDISDEGKAWIKANGLPKSW